MTPRVASESGVPADEQCVPDEVRLGLLRHLLNGVGANARRAHDLGDAVVVREQVVDAPARQIAERRRGQVRVHVEHRGSRRRSAWCGRARPPPGAAVRYSMDRDCGQSRTNGSRSSLGSAQRSLGTIGVQPGRPGSWSYAIRPEFAGTAPRTRASFSRSSLTPRPGPVGHANRAVLVRHLAALDDVVGQVVIVRVGGEREIRHDGAEVQHRRELNAELAGRVHRDAELEGLAHAGGLDARRGCRPRTSCRAGSRPPRVFSTLAASCSKLTTTVLVASGTRTFSRARRMPFRP